jgi:hypothetical protein
MLKTERIPNLFLQPQDSTSQSPDKFWGSPSLLSNGYRGLFPRG